MTTSGDSDVSPSWRQVLSPVFRYWLLVFLYSLALTIAIGLPALLVMAVVGHFDDATNAPAPNNDTVSDAADDADPFTFAVDSPLVLPFVLAGAVAALLATRPVAAKEGLSWSDVGFERTKGMQLFALGLVVGLASFAIIPLVGVIIGHAEVTRSAAGFDALLSLGIALVVLLAVSVTEEVASRGLPLTLLARKGRAAAVAITAVVFASLHAANPGGTSPAAIFALIVTGSVLAISRFATGSLWLPIGWHLGWNLSEGWLFGCSVSGTGNATSPLFATNFTGSEALFGSRFGPESGLLAVLADCLGLVAVFALRPGSRSPR